MAQEMAKEFSDRSAVADETVPVVLDTSDLDNNAISQTYPAARDGAGINVPANNRLKFQADGKSAELTETDAESTKPSLDLVSATGALPEVAVSGAVVNDHLKCQAANDEESSVGEHGVDEGDSDEWQRGKAAHIRQVATCPCLLLAVNGNGVNF